MMRNGLRSLAIAAVMASPALAQEDGAALFGTHCSACHGAAGEGVPGFAPPLDRPEFWQAFGDDGPAYIAGIVTKGFAAPITVRGESFAGMVMPPVMGATDEDLAQATTWVLSELGQTEQVVTPALLAERRDSNVTHADLKAMRPDVE